MPDRSTGSGAADGMAMPIGSIEVAESGSYNRPIGGLAWLHQLRPRFGEAAMYTPAAFRQDDLVTLHQQIRATRLPTLVSHGANGLLASHLPLLPAADDGPYGTLYGHFAPGNPQRRE